MIYPPNRILLFFVMLFCSGHLLGQTRTLYGVVIDSVSHEPLRNASIYNETNKEGIRSDSLGKFKIPVGKVTLVVSMIGYGSKTVTAGNDNLVVALVPETNDMQQVVVTNKRGKYRNKDNPAVGLIRKVIANKEQNRPEAVDYARYEEYDKMEISLRDLDPKKFGKRMLRPYRFLFDHPDTVAGDSSRYYPVYLEEKLSDNYIQKKPAREKRHPSPPRPPPPRSRKRAPSTSKPSR